MCTFPSTCSQPEPHLSTNVVSVTVSFSEKTGIYFDAVGKFLRVGLELFSLCLPFWSIKGPSFRDFWALVEYSQPNLNFLSEKQWDCLTPKSFAPRVVFEKTIQAGFNLFFKWKLVTHVHVITQWMKGLNCFQSYFSRRHFETLPGYFSCILTVQFRLITMGNKVPLESKRQSSVVHVIQNLLYLLFSRYNVPGKLN